MANLIFVTRKPRRLCTFHCTVCGVARLVSGATNRFRCEIHRPSDPTGKLRAGSEVAMAIREGRLTHPRTLKCSDCCGTASEYDHRDYNFPLRVDPVCRGCNARRGPAIPRKGFFAEVFETEYGFYTNRVNMERLFKVIGLKANLGHLPAKTEFEHWLPFKEALLEWEKAA